MNLYSQGASTLVLAGTTNPDEQEHPPADESDRDPREVSDEQLDEALKETFPASDPISP